MFLDDNLTNVEAAREAGMRAAQVDGVGGAERALLEAGVIRQRTLLDPQRRRRQPAA